ncbi:MAG: cupin domain-containing protein [Bacteroidota bacterium]
MKKSPLLLLLLFCICSTNYAQQADEDILQPILLDKSVLSGVGLKKIDLKNEPEKDFYQKRLYRGEDISIYVVSTETWNNKMENFPFDEFIYMFHGEAVVKPENGKTQLFQSGDYFFAPKGYTGEWEIRAGDYLHYELSVIATKRSDSTTIQKDATHQLFDRSTLSGAAITLDENGQFAEVLEKGAELTIQLNAELPKEASVNESSKEQLIHVLSGQITIISQDNTEQIFYAGDFFVLPESFTGKWKSEGHGLVKYLIVEKTS